MESRWGAGVSNCLRTAVGVGVTLEMRVGLDVRAIWKWHASEWVWDQLWVVSGAVGGMGLTGAEDRDKDLGGTFGLGNQTQVQQMHCRADLCLARGGGGLWGCLRTRQPTHPPTMTHPPTHPDLCCNNQVVTQKPCVFAQKKLCHSVTMPSLNRRIAQLTVTLVVDRCTVKLAQRWFKPHCLHTGKFCHFLPLFSQ